MTNLNTDQPAPQTLRTFTWLWLTQSVSIFGDYLALFGSNLWLTTRFVGEDQRAQLAGALVAVNIAFMIPNILLAPLVGAWVDRLDRRRVMLVSNLLSAALTVLYLWALISGSMTVPLLVLLSLCSACLGIFHEVSFEASFSMVVPQSQMTRAGGMMQTSLSLARVLGPAVGALLIALPALFGWRWLSSSAGIPLLYLLDLASYLIAGLALLFLTIPSPPRKDGPPVPLLKNVGEAFGFLKTHPVLFQFLGLFALLNLFTFPTVLFETLMVSTNLVGDLAARGLSKAAGLAWMTGGAGVGGVGMGLLLSSWGGLKGRRVYGVLLPMMTAGLGIITLGLSRSLPLSVAAMILIGASLPFVTAHSRTIWAARVPREMQGRMFALRRMLSQGTGPLALLLAGALIALRPAGQVAVLMGCGAVLVGLSGLLRPAIRNIEETVPDGTGVAAD